MTFRFSMTVRTPLYIIDTSIDVSVFKKWSIKIWLYGSQETVLGLKYILDMLLYPTHTFRQAFGTHLLPCCPPDTSSSFDGLKAWSFL